MRFITGTGRKGFDKFERDISENVSLYRVGETAAGFQVRLKIDVKSNKLQLHQNSHTLSADQKERGLWERGWLSHY